jgi:hemolysin-activating ACP:hemolysin acyltransferase
VSDKFLRRAIFFGLGAFFIGMISRLTIVDLDLYHQMALIREVYRLGYFPQVDLFSYLHTVRPLSHHEWGNGALIYLITVQSGLGTAGLMFLKYLLAAFVALGCFVFATRQGASLYVFSAFAPLGIGLGWCGFTTIRAQLFSICFLLVLLFLLEEDRKGKRWPLWA